MAHGFTPVHAVTVSLSSMAEDATRYEDTYRVLRAWFEDCGVRIRESDGIYSAELPNKTITHAYTFPSLLEKMLEHVGIFVRDEPHALPLIG